ncbi:MAG: 30S ribosomal protein S1 [Cyanobacteria bacterium HKST-UBA06]|nr:30S ribosomal protein S1 [Cyanobacteria bacterium HKST-UBA04]MCA9807927.1 30S ribosomal protein S1 [Cyanobacteria bacterium HKST-UBA06]MCA9840790.1 30S ribosomal protein S1 [Cyanobacteria bacterium HKST-UBA03]
MSSHNPRHRDLDALFNDEDDTLKQKFSELLAQYDYDFNRGDIVKGKIMMADNNVAYVEIHAKTAAILPRKEYAYTRDENENKVFESLAPGTEMEFYILREEDEDGQITLSRRRVFMAQSWNELQKLADSDEVIDCTVSAVVKGGLLVDVQGLRGFVPSSHLRLRTPMEQAVGQTLPFKILSLDPVRNNIILSHRKVMAERLAEQRRDLFKDLEEGHVIEGEVVRLTDFGAFIDLGGIDGLLPLSQMSWRWVEHPSDILKVGEKTKVEVIGIDKDKQRVSLSIKSQFPDPWVEVVKALGLNQKVEGTVTRIKHFGAFVEVFPGVEALLPSRDINDHTNQTGEKIEVGSKIETYIVKFNPEERRISLSFTQLSEHQADQMRQYAAQNAASDNG